ncbi:MAG: thermonuclease family protein [Burkholderiales bacterium]
MCDRPIRRSTAPSSPGATACKRRPTDLLWRWPIQVGKVIVDGDDARLEQVRAGLAWWCGVRAREQTPDEREVYELAEKEARARKLRLWRDPDPVPPREWRRSTRSPKD